MTHHTLPILFAALVTVPVLAVLYSVLIRRRRRQTAAYSGLRYVAGPPGSAASAAPGRRPWTSRPSALAAWA